MRERSRGRGDPANGVGSLSLLSRPCSIHCRPLPVHGTFHREPASLAYLRHAPCPLLRSTVRDGDCVVPAFATSLTHSNPFGRVRSCEPTADPSSARRRGRAAAARFPACPYTSKPWRSSRRYVP